MTAERIEGQEREEQVFGASEASGYLVVQGSEGLVLPEDTDLDGLIGLLSSSSTQAVTREEYLGEMEKRQRAVDQHLLRGGADTLRKFFERVKQLERQRNQQIKIDLSMLAISGKLLTNLYLPGSNLEKLVVTDSDLGGSDLSGTNLRQSVGLRSKWRGAILTGADLSDAVFPQADFSGARLIGVNFSNTHLTDIIVDADTNFAGSLFIGTYLGNTNLGIANTTGAIFRGLRR